MSIQDMDEETLCAADMPFSTTSASGHVVPLTTRVSRIAVDNRSDYVRLALAYRSLHNALLVADLSVGLI